MDRHSRRTPTRKPHFGDLGCRLTHQPTYYQLLYSTYIGVCTRQPFHPGYLASPTAAPPKPPRSHIASHFSSASLLISISPSIGKQVFHPYLPTTLPRALDCDPGVSKNQLWLPLPSATPWVLWGGAEETQRFLSTQIPPLSWAGFRI